jgi:hypothetical protein
VRPLLLYLVVSCGGPPFVELADAGLADARATVVDGDANVDAAPTDANAKTEAEAADPEATAPTPEASTPEAAPEASPEGSPSPEASPEAATCGSPTDPQNCGGCGVVCPAVPCASGKCQCPGSTVACYVDFASGLMLVCTQSADVQALCQGFPNDGGP